MTSTITLIPSYRSRPLAKAYTQERLLVIYENIIKPDGDTHYLEMFYNDVIVRPYFDYDYECEYSDEEMTKSLALCKENIHKIFSSEDGSLLNDADIAVAQRHRKDKISFRFYVKGFKIMYRDIAGHIRRVGQAGFWDISVYDKNSLLYVIGTVKENGSNIPLTPSTHVDEPQAFFAQWLYGDEQMIESCEDGVVYDNDDTDLGVESDVIVASIKVAMRENKISGYRFDSRNGNTYRFSADKHKGAVCPHTGEKHYSNGCYVKALIDGTLSIFCLGKHGIDKRYKDLGRWKEAVCEIEDDSVPPKKRSHKKKPAPKKPNYLKECMYPTVLPKKQVIYTKEYVEPFWQYMGKKDSNPFLISNEKYKHIFIKAIMGGGKTYQTILALSKHLWIKSVLILGSRVAYCESMVVSILESRRDF